MNFKSLISQFPLNQIDLHTHTIYSDGKNSPEEMILSAISKGIKIFGISDHSYVPFDPECGIKPENSLKYIKEIKSLKEKYKNQITVLLGLEQDYYSSSPLNNYDYIIGSVHYMKKNNEIYSIDLNPEETQKCIDSFFDGDSEAFVLEYYRMVIEHCKKNYIDIIGHLNLFTKFENKGLPFNENSNKIESCKNDLIESLKNKILEVNVGGISRGYKITPYPDKAVIKKWINGQNQIILSSDSHDLENIAYNFESTLKYILK